MGIPSMNLYKYHISNHFIFLQDVVSCSLLSQGCDGGFSFLIAGRYAKDQGMVAEECNPYTGKVRAESAQFIDQDVYS